MESSLSKFQLHNETTLLRDRMGGARGERLARLHRHGSDPADALGESAGRSGRRIWPDERRFIVWALGRAEGRWTWGSGAGEVFIGKKKERAYRWWSSGRRRGAQVDPPGDLGSGDGATEVGELGTTGSLSAGESQSTPRVKEGGSSSSASGLVFPPRPKRRPPKRSKVEGVPDFIEEGKEE